MAHTLKWVNDPEVTYFTGTSFPISEMEHEKWWDDTPRDRTQLLLALTTSHGRHVGNIGLKDIRWVHRRAEVWMYIGDKSSRERGLGPAALQGFVDYCFRYLNLHRLYAYVFEFNTRALRMMRTCGFRREGVCREHVFRNGRFFDAVLWGIVKGDR